MTNQTARVAQVLLRPQLGGAETLVNSLEAQFRERGIATSVAYLEPDGIPLGSFDRLRSLGGQLRDFHPTHVLAHSALPNIYARLAAPPRTPVTCVLHSAADDFANPVLRAAEWALLPRTHAVVAVSEVARQQYTGRFPKRVRVFLINNGAGEAFRPSEPAKRPTKFISVARVADQKNPNVWVAAVDILATARPGVHLTWWGPAGSDEYRERMDTFNRDHLNGEFAGPTTAVSERMREADAFLHTADSEANSIVLLEAAASGLPLICSEAVAATLPEGFVCTTFSTGDASSCAAAVEEVCDNWVAKSDGAASNQRLVEQHFRMGAVATRYLDVLGIA